MAKKQALTISEILAALDEDIDQLTDKELNEVQRLVTEVQAERLEFLRQEVQFLLDQGFEKVQ